MHFLSNRHVPPSIPVDEGTDSEPCHRVPQYDSYEPAACNMHPDDSRPGWQSRRRVRLETEEGERLPDRARGEHSLCRVLGELLDRACNLLEPVFSRVGGGAGSIAYFY